MDVMDELRDPDAPIPVGGQGADLPERRTGTDIRDWGDPERRPGEPGVIYSDGGLFERIDAWRELAEGET